MRTLLLCIVMVLATSLAAELALIQPKDLAAQLAAKGAHPAILQVGPNVLYRAKHIPGAIYAGPGSKPEGLDLLKEAVKGIAHDREVILYCGCCPWDKCPNVKPAVALLQQLGFTHVKAMYVENSFAKDWTEQSYPVESSAAKQ